MAITYTVGTNTITVTGYTEVTPCNFTDLYNADKAGILSLHARTGITGTDGAPVAVDRAERPADYVVLGGASNDLYIAITNWNGTNATIRITGTDRDNAAQTEDIVINANGTYYTTKWFKTITTTQVTAFVAVTFDYDLTQGQWGVIWKLGGNLFKVDALAIQIGQGSTTTWFKSTKDAVLFTVTGTIKTDGNLEVPNLGHLQFGNLTNNIPCDGSYILVDHSAAAAIIYNYSSGGYLKMYDSKIEALNSKPTIYDGSSHTDLRYVTLNNMRRFDFKNADTIIKDFVNQASEYGGHIVTTPATAFDNYRTFGGDPGINDRGITFMADATVKNVFVDPTTTISIRPQYAGTNAIVIDGDFDFTDVACHLTSDLIAKYSFDLKVIDKDENPINTATVKMWDKDSNLVVDTTTNVSGVITTQELNYGRWALVGAVTVLTLQTPHLIRIEKAGYTTYEADFTLEEKIDWTIALKTIAINIDSEVIT